MKYFTFIALAFNCIFTATEAQVPNQTNDTRPWLYEGHLSYNGNELTISVPFRDTIPVEDPETGEIWYKIVGERMVTELNGKKVFNEYDDARQPRAGRKGWKHKVENRLEKELQQSRNYFDHALIVVDEHGKLAYLDVKFWTKPSPDNDTPMMENTKTEIIKSINNKLSAMRFKPAKKDGYAVPYCLLFE
ncbi:MAG TPA: hypothetical protein VEB40_03355 [Flavipsychrobacter sp.]|nr:hypothetical protein [Flavipsychrobacter sp.]